MYALDAKTGKIVWEFYLVPKAEGDPTRGPLGASPLNASTWGNSEGVPITGGATWTQMGCSVRNNPSAVTSTRSSNRSSRRPFPTTSLW